jgi:multiple sugar transport system ATP-binding protein
MDVYTRPVDLFVARFIGWPPMTLIEADLVEEGDDVVVDAGRWRVPLRTETLAARPGIRDLLGRRLGVGFRPESLRPDPGGPVVADVVSVETIGPDQVVHAVIEATPLEADETDAVLRRGRARVAFVLDAHRGVDRWRPLRLGVDTDAVHFFDLDTRRTLAPAPITS